MNKVTEEHIKAKIRNVEYLHHGTKTFCILTLENGFTVTGESDCVDPSNYDRKIGEQVAYGEAVDHVWPLEGYLLKELMYREGRA
jgi:hypothetical protein